MHYGTAAASPAFTRAILSCWVWHFFREVFQVAALLACSYQLSPATHFGAVFAIYEPRGIKGRLLSETIAGNTGSAFLTDARSCHNILHALRLGRPLTLPSSTWELVERTRRFSILTCLCCAII